MRTSCYVLNQASSKSKLACFFNMRFNQRELAFIALQPPETFDRQGLLWLKEKDGYFWQRTECEFILNDIQEL